MNQRELQLIEDLIDAKINIAFGRGERYLNEQFLDQTKEELLEGEE